MLIAGRPGDLAPRDGGAADDAGAKHVAAGQRVQQRRLAAGDRAERDDLEPLRLALGFELGDGGLDLGPQFRRDAFAAGEIFAGRQIIAQLAGCVRQSDISLGLSCAALRPRPSSAACSARRARASPPRGPNSTSAPVPTAAR